MSYMTQSKDYYEDCRSSCTVLTPYCEPACCTYTPPCCPNYSNCCCEQVPCVIKPICNSPMCVPRRVCYIRKSLPCCTTPCGSLCSPACCECPCCKPISCCRREKKVRCCCTTEDDSNKEEGIKHLMLGLILLAAFAILIFSFNQQLIAPCKRRFFI